MTTTQARFQLDVDMKSIDALDDGSLLLRGYASVFTQDRDRETVQPEAIKSAIAAYMANPILLWQHNAERPIGFIRQAFVDAKGLMVDAVVPMPAPGSEAWHVKAFHDLKSGLVRCFSIGGLFKKQAAAIVRMDLMEISCVSVPAHPSAIFEVVRKAFDLKAMPATTAVDGDEGDPPEGSYEDLIADLNRELMMMYPAPQCPRVLATFPDYVIVSVCDMPSMDAEMPMTMPEMDYYRVAYTLDGSGEPVLGEAQEVQRMYVPGSESNDMDEGKATDLRRIARKAAMTAAQRNKMDAGDFGYMDSDGKGHFPVHDADHVRAAISMFSRASFPDAATKKKCAAKILSRAKKFGIDVAADSAVAQAASGKSAELAALMAQLNADFDAILSR